MTATAPYYGLALRKRTPTSSRTLAPDVGGRFSGMRANGERLLREPFKGVTTDGNVVPGLFPLDSTGVPGNDYGRDYLRQHHAQFQHINGQHVPRIG